MPNRCLRPDLQVWFQRSLAAEIGPLPPKYSGNWDLNLLVLAAAHASVGVMEEEGHNKGRVVEYFQSTIGVAEGESWCAAFLQSCVAFAERYSMHKSGLYASESCIEMFNKSKANQVEVPQVGDFIVWQKEGSWQGHVGVISEILFDDEGIVEGYRTIEGNTSSGRAIDREGDGCYLRTRPRGGIGKMKVLGFLRPFPSLAPATVELAH